MDRVKIEKTEKPQKFVVYQPIIDDKPIEGVSYCFRSASDISGHSVLITMVGLEIDGGFGEVAFNTNPIGGGNLKIIGKKVFIYGASMTYGSVDKKILQGLEADIKNAAGADEVVFDDPDLPGGNLFALYK